ncbi:malate synthase A [Sporosarcina cyprini]|uniref:malate synthase A n=1 Tax=Sporosarcina cyprini TaxID=2910523 RepID=UPI001EDDEBAB|nr:malate synthase A [Sporosarcina cyprini]MCG3088182.1 malate synthase A [Sporosarcina cyprini]
MRPLTTQQTRFTIDILGEITAGTEEILTPEALEFLYALHSEFNERRKALLEERQHRQKRLDQGERLGFLEETRSIREGDWTVAPIPSDLQDRRVEITGPVDRKMIINAMNCGAKAFMADFEDATSPTWTNVIDGQVNLKDAVRRTISYEHPISGKKYALNEETAVLIVRTRGLHLEEKHVVIEGERIAGAFFDFGLYFFHNAKELIQRGTGPYFYLPKLESHLEARLWNDLFVFAQEKLGIPQGTIRATVLIETITAAFEMDEILYELREHATGLNCGRWDYIFSFVKRLRNHPDIILPDRNQVTMTSPFMRAYSQLCIQTCHRRNAFAMGGMAAQIPIRDNATANEDAFRKVSEDKKREVLEGHDGTWVAHPGLVAVAMAEFNEQMKTPNQLHRKREDVQVTADDLLQPPQGSITEEGLRMNCSVGVQYIASWLVGQGAAPINHLMEDAATAEISRSQVWQWIRHPKGVLADGRNITTDLFKTMLEEEMKKIATEAGERRYKLGRFQEAGELFQSMVLQDDFVEFLTLPGYEKI